MTAIDDPVVTVRLTEPEAIANIRIVLELCASEMLRCSEKTRRPTAASVSGLAVNTTCLWSTAGREVTPSPGHRAPGVPGRPAPLFSSDGA